jgi:hypothetical protein
MRVIGIAIEAGKPCPFPFSSGDRILERDFLNEIDAVKFAQGRYGAPPEDNFTRTHMILLRIDTHNPKVIAVLDFKEGK